MLAAYLLFVILPHFAVIAHTHMGGNLHHTHSFQSVQNENLSRGILVALGTSGGGLNLPAVASEPRDEAAPALFPVERGTSALQPLSLWHTHFQEDPNLLAVGVAIAVILSLIALQKLPAFRSPFVPARPQFSPCARGPPAFFFHT